MDLTDSVTKEETKDFYIEWKQCIMCNNMSGRPFIVYHYSDDDFDYYKPYKKYSKFEFEQLFNFKMGSPDYDCNRIIKISK